MRRDDLNIPEPCDADWDAMTGDDRKRFCSSCTKHVHNLSEMDQQDARHLLETSENLCVQYASHHSGEVFFRDSTHPSWRLHRQVEGAKRLLAAALLVPLVAACDAPEPSSSAIAPVILINPDGSIKTPDPGAGLAPTMIATPTEVEPVEVLRGEPEPIEHELGNLAIEEPPQTEEIEMLQGDIAYEPDDHPSAEDDSDKEDAACDPDSTQNAQPTHDTTKTTVKTRPSAEHTILRGKVAPNRKPRPDKPLKNVLTGW